MQGTSTTLSSVEMIEECSHLSRDFYYDSTERGYFHHSMLSAIRLGKLEDVRKAIEGIDASATLRLIDSYTLVLAAVHYGRMCILKLLISYGAAVNRPSREFTPLHLACMKGSSLLAQCLLKAGANVNMRNREGQTPLHYAVQVDNIRSELTKFGRTRSLQYYKYLSHTLTHLLLQNVAPINCMDYSGMTPLHYAVKQNNIDVVPLLLECDADIEMKDRYKRTPLWYAVSGGNMKLVIMLLEAGSQLYVEDELGLSMLHVAVGRDNIDMVRFLLGYSTIWQQEGMINKPCSRGESCLFFALDNLNIEMVNLLISSGANVEIINSFDGNTPLIAACSMLRKVIYGLPQNQHFLFNDVLTGSHSCDHCEIVKLLIKKSVDVNRRNLMKATALHLAARHDLLCVVKLLLGKGADANLCDSDGLTPVHLAVENQGFLMTKMLLENKADADAKGTDYLTPLHLAVITPVGQDNMALDLVKLLLEYDAEVNARDMAGLTPLHLVLRNALSGKSFSLLTDSLIINTLLDHGANVFIKSNQGRSSFSIAASWFLTHVEDACGALKKILHTVYLHGIKTAVASPAMFGPIDCQSELLIPQLLEVEREHTYYLSCLREIASLKDNLVIAGVSYYDIFAIPIKKFATYLRNPSLEAPLSQANYLEVFPIYGPVIQFKFNKSLKRKLFLDAGKMFFTCLSEFSSYPRLPIICVEIILNYLSNNDFRSIQKIL